MRTVLIFCAVLFFVGTFILIASFPNMQFLGVPVGFLTAALAAIALVLLAILDKDCCAGRSYGPKK